MAHNELIAADVLKGVNPLVTRLFVKWLKGAAATRRKAREFLAIFRSPGHPSSEMFRVWQLYRQL